MKNRITKIAALAALISISLPVAFAQDEAAKEQKDNNPFIKADASKDGYLSKEEFMTLPANKDNDKAEKRFATLDKDGDGKVSAEEFKAGMGKKKKKKAD